MRHVDAASGDAGERRTSLIKLRWRCKGRVACVNGWASGQKGVRLSGTSVVGQRPEHRVDDAVDRAADEVAVNVWCPVGCVKTSA